MIKLLLFVCTGDRGGRGGGGGGGGFGGGRSGDMEIQQDTIFVSGMGQDCSEELLVQHFGSIGVVKVNINIYITSSVVQPINNSMT